ncbi:MAG TPA: HAD family hydrolase [Stellaceae bacterium]|nr:HAD family hydrolase [Stellaceae bacterium]
MADDSAFIFDLDGTLMDSVYQHVLSWAEALEAEGIEVPIWRVHRRIGMSGGLFSQALMRESGLELDEKSRTRLSRGHADAFMKRVAAIRPLPGASALLAHLTALDIPWAIATSGRAETAAPMIDKLGLPVDRMTIVTRDQVAFAKPNPDLFLEAARRLDRPPGACFVVGDSIWDMLAARRAGSLGVGLLSGGYGDDELVRAGAFRVFAEPADLFTGLFELGIRS